MRKPTRKDSCCLTVKSKQGFQFCSALRKSSKENNNLRRSDKGFKRREKRKRKSKLEESRRRNEKSFNRSYQLGACEQSFQRHHKEDQKRSPEFEFLLRIRNKDLLNEIMKKL